MGKGEGDPAGDHSFRWNRAVHPGRDLAAYRAIGKTCQMGEAHVAHTHSAKAGILGRTCWGNTSPAIVHTVHGTR